MNQRIIHNLVWVPIFLVGLTALAFGLIWVSHPEPWLIDQLPNEELLQTTFEDLFSLKNNIYLPSYLKVIYTFFGLWLITVGLLILIFVKITRLGTKQARASIYVTLFFTLIILYYLMFTYLKTSPLFPVLYVFTFLLGLSAYSSTLIRDP